MITVIAGVNGAGKSSIAGTAIRKALGSDYYNADEQARRILHLDTTLSPAQANSRAWKLGFQLLKRAILLDDDFALETTLGGSTITRTLLNAIDTGRKVSIFYIGLETPELHIQRVNERAARGGHPIGETNIRQRWVSSQSNMIKLIPGCYEVKVYDNSLPLRNGKPRAICLFHLRQAQFIQPPVKNMPAWARPLAVAAMKQVS